MDDPIYSSEVFYCVDDDVLYPEDFARQLATFLSRNKKSVVGIHGSVILPCFKSWRQDRKIYCARKRLLIKKKVDVLATNGCAFFASALRICPENWPEKYKNCCY